MIKRLFGVLVALMLLTGFAACGDDDDDDVTVEEDVEEEATDEESDVADEEEATDDEAMDEEATDDEAMDEGGDSDIGPATQEFCTEFNDESGGDTPIEELQASMERAQAAQAEIADPEVTSAIDGLLVLAQYLIDNDDGDGVVTDAETQAGVEANPDVVTQLETISTFCSA